MKKSTLIAGTLGAMIVAATAFGQMGMRGGMGMMGGFALRHQFVAQNGIDPKYASKSNPLRATAENLAAGEKLYQANCASCHGATGFGDGPAAKSLNPPPANIAASARMPMTSDGYLYWTIAEGGVPLHTAMPPFKSALTDEEIWKVILYVRRL